jgi:cytochrome c biogenesis protein CcdA
MIAGSVVLAFMAGTLSVLSPCVLPILPIVLGAAASTDKRGPLALATGLALSFVVVGLFVATIGYAIGLDGDVFRTVSALLMIAIGTVLLVPRFAAGLAVASGPIANWTDQRFENLRGGGLPAQFWIGVLLGAVWSPCVGPTLGAASLLAAQGRDLPQVALIMFVFGIGAALPLLILGVLSREAVLRWRHRLASAGQGLKSGLGLLLIAIGALALTGADKSIEAWLVNASPQWLTDLTTRL